MYTYSNSFHNTEVHSRYSPEQLEIIKAGLYMGVATKAEKALKRRIRRFAAYQIVCVGMNLESGVDKC
jgi:hypothetical protein